jgi:hypothetical protein
MVFTMLLGGMNDNNNLGLGLTFVLASLGLVAMHHCHGTLAGLRVRLLEAEPAFVGQQVCYRLLLENAARVPRPALELEITPHRAGHCRRRPPRRRPTCAFRRATRPPAFERFVIATRRSACSARRIIHRLRRRLRGPSRRGERAPPRRAPTPAAHGTMRSAMGLHRAACIPAGHSSVASRGKRTRGQGCTRSSTPSPTSCRTCSIGTCPGWTRNHGWPAGCWMLDAHERGEAFGLRLPGIAIGLNVGAA